MLNDVIDDAEIEGKMNTVMMTTRRAPTSFSDGAVTLRISVRTSL